jgi:hypothetical protein
MYCHAVKLMLTNVSEVHTASINRAMSHESSPWWWRQYAPLKSRSSIWLNDSTSQKTLNFILTTMRTWNLTGFFLIAMFVMVFKTIKCHLFSGLCVYTYSFFPYSQSRMRRVQLVSQSAISKIKLLLYNMSSKCFTVNLNNIFHIHKGLLYLFLHSNTDSTKFVCPIVWKIPLC